MELVGIRKENLGVSYHHTSPVNARTVSPPSARLLGTLTQSAVNGIATFPDLRLNVRADGYALEASSGGLASALSDSFDIQGATGLAFQQQPENTLVGATSAGEVSG